MVEHHLKKFWPFAGLQVCVNTMPRRKDTSSDLREAIWEGLFQTIWSPSFYGEKDYSQVGNIQDSCRSSQVVVSSSLSFQRPATLPESGSAGGFFPLKFRFDYVWLELDCNFEVPEMTLVVICRCINKTELN